MAEVANTASLIASIESLDEAAARVAARLHKFKRRTTNEPKCFRSLSRRLPSLISSLQLIAQQARAGHLPDHATSALRLDVQSTSAQLSTVDAHLSQITPSTSTSRLQQAVKVLQRLGKDAEVQAAVEKTTKKIDSFLRQAAQYKQPSDSSDQITGALSALQLDSRLPALPRGHAFQTVSAHNNATLHLGDVYHITHAQEPPQPKPLGLCLGLAPLIEAANFIGRAPELDQMAQILLPGESAVEQRRVVLGGIGGIGKTQLAIAYARRYQSSYTSVLWLNAMTELTLNESFRSIAQRLFTRQQLESLANQDLIQEVFGWLVRPSNLAWLLILDNYDDPDLFDLFSYVPDCAHGSIIVTTRLPDLVRSQQVRQVRVPPINHLDESLDILEARSHRPNLKLDPSARRLAERLAGLPLALATAGAYLRKTTLTFDQYLRAYEQRFNVNPRRPVQLQEYADRTLFTTWNLSYTRLESDSPLAAKTLQLLAYFDNQDIWFELIQAGLDDDSPEWLQEAAGGHVDFNNTMSVLVEYCFLEVHSATGSYSMHNCVHDWTLAKLNESPNQQLYWYVSSCVAYSLFDVRLDDYKLLKYARLSRHGERLTHARFKDILLNNSTSVGLHDINRVAHLLAEQERLSAAEEMYLRALAGSERVHGPDHQLTLHLLNNLALVYKDQNRNAEAEQMHLRVLAGRETTLGPDHHSTISTVLNLGITYRRQGRLDEAEQMYMRGLAAREKMFGPNHISILDIAQNLGVLYDDQDRQNEAEQMYVRALTGFEEALGPDAVSTLQNVNNLATIYDNQNKHNEAEQMYLRALAGKERVLGPNHTNTLNTVYNLARMYKVQGKLAEAEPMFLRALAGYDKALGPNHVSTLNTLGPLGNLYFDLDKLDEAEHMYTRALAGYEKTFGPNDTNTTLMIENLGLLYEEQGRIDQAEQMNLRILATHEKLLGPDADLTLQTVCDLGRLYRIHDREDKAEQMYLRAIAGKEKTLGPNDISTLTTVNDLGHVYYNQDRLDEARQMYLRVLAGREKALGPDHIHTLNAAYNLGALFDYQGKLDESEQMYTRALVGYEKALGRNDPYVSDTVEYLNDVYRRQGREEVAEQILKSTTFTDN